MSTNTTTVVCIGAGPAGLTAAYHLAKNNVSVVVLEADPVYVGGIARTHKYKDFRFDIGGHRFFSKSKEIEDLWTEILPDDFLVRPRSSKIFYRNRFFPYPLKPIVTFTRLGPVETIRSILSYFKARIFPYKSPKNFEEWIVNRFGQRLFEIFFKTYSEKVWGKPCQSISADWAEQRIQDFSLMQAAKEMLTPAFIKKGGAPKTLLTSFRYPRLGPGMLWEKTTEKIRLCGGEVVLGARVTSLTYENLAWNISFEKNGIVSNFICQHVISTLPINQLCKFITPAPQSSALAQNLEYRDFIIVALVTKSPEAFTDQWLYIHDPRVKTCRIQNFKAWSPEMVPSAEYNCYGLEYFCTEGDDIWSKSDADLIKLATAEAELIKLTPPGSVIDFCVVRQKRAYPVYGPNYEKVLHEVKTDLEANFPNLHLSGRNGMHRYNNQDHAMMTGILNAKNIIAGKKIYDPWLVNQDAGYLEK